MTNNELINAITDLLESIAEYSRDSSDANWLKIITQSIQIDIMIEESNPPENDGQPSELQEWHDFDSDC